MTDQKHHEILLQATVGAELAEARLDQALASLFPDYSRSRLQAWTREGRVLVNGEQRRSNMTDENKRKMEQVRAGQENMIELIKKYDILTGFSTDFIFGKYQDLPREFTERALFWSPVEVLRQATSQGGEVIRMAGKLNRHGNFGEIREGWVADMLIFEGELLEDLSLIDDPDRNLKVIIKGGELVKNTLQ